MSYVPMTYVWVPYMRLVETLNQLIAKMTLATTVMIEKVLLSQFLGAPFNIARLLF